MGNVVYREKVNMPTCGQMFDALRNIQESACWNHPYFFIDNFPVARLTYMDIYLNGNELCGVQVLEKKPVKSEIPENVERLIGRHNAIALINGVLVGIAQENDVWVARRELDDRDLLSFYSQFLENYAI